ncbi:MAG: hypothetical protein QM723_18470 [Myxococcaceae bacterium]
MRSIAVVCVWLVGCFQPTHEGSASDAMAIDGPMGSRLLVPDGAVNPSTKVALEVVSDGYPALPNGADGAVFSLTPQGQMFAMPVTVTLPVGDGNSLWRVDKMGAWTKVTAAVRLANSWVVSVDASTYFVSVSSASSGSSRIYFGNGPSLSVFDLATNTESDLVPGSADSNYVTAVTVDVGASTVYWTDNFSDAVARVAMTGGPSATLHTAGDSFSNPAGVAIDTAANKLFWAESPNVMSSALDGSGAHAIVAGTQGSDFITSVAVDVSSQRVYWTNNGNDTVSSATYAGADVKVLHTASDRFANPAGVAIDGSNGKLFWCEGNDVMSSALDGSGAVAVIPGTMENFPTAVAVDPAAQLIYWTDNGTDALSSAAYDGSHAHTLYTNPDRYSNPAGVAVAP